MTNIAAFSKTLMVGALFVVASSASAIELLSGLGGTSGYGELTQGRNDDSSSNRLNLPFTVNFFGNSYSSFFVNNNGNVTFNGAVSGYTPTPFPVSRQPMIAPFWGDVDTSCAGCGAVYIAAPNTDTVVVTWNDVGYFSASNDKTNNFQLVLRNQGAGNFDVEFRYDRLTWTTGNASGGSGGLGGTPAQAGYDSGNSRDFFTIPGSRTAAVLNLATTSNVSAATPGLWSYSIREGVLPGATPSNPLLPVIVNGAFTFDFNVVIPTQRIFIDPVVAVGYDYVVTNGPLIASVNFTTNLNDPNGYELRDLAGNLLAVLQVGEIYNFASAVSGFRVTGIEPSAGVDPNNGLAFVTGLTFASAGRLQMTQTPITFDTGGGGGVPPSDVPLPSGLALVLIGGLAILRKKHS